MKRRISCSCSRRGRRFSGVSGLTLDEALARALEKNPRIQQAKTAVEQAAGQRLVFGSVALPVASISAPAGVQGGNRAGQAAESSRLPLPKAPSGSHSFTRRFRPPCGAATSQCWSPPRS